MELLNDAATWVLISFCIFAFFAFHLGKGKILGKLDGRIEEIRKEIATAESLRIEAQELLAQYQRKHRDAAKEAEAIVAAARKDADALLKQAESELQETIRRREQHLQERLQRMEEKAIADIRAHAADLAVKATAEIIAEKMDEKANENLVEQSIRQIAGRLD